MILSIFPYLKEVGKPSMVFQPLVAEGGQGNHSRKGIHYSLQVAILGEHLVQLRPQQRLVNVERCHHDTQEVIKPHGKVKGLVRKPKRDECIHR